MKALFNYEGCKGAVKLSNYYSSSNALVSLLIVTQYLKEQLQRHSCDTRAPLFQTKFCMKISHGAAAVPQTHAAASLQAFNLKELLCSENKMLGVL